MNARKDDNSDKEDENKKIKLVGIKTSLPVHSRKDVLITVISSYSNPNLL